MGSNVRVWIHGSLVYGNHSYRWELSNHLNLNGLNTCSWLKVCERQNLEWRLWACTVSPVTVARSTEIRVTKHHWHIHLRQANKLAVSEHRFSNEYSIQLQTPKSTPQIPLHDQIIKAASDIKLHPNNINRQGGLFFAGHGSFSFSHKDSERCFPKTDLHTCSHLPCSLTVQPSQQLHQDPNQCIPLSPPLACHPLGPYRLTPI